MMQAVVVFVAYLVVVTVVLMRANGLGPWR